MPSRTKGFTRKQQILLTDEELVEKVRTQDTKLYEEIVKRYETQLLRYATYVVKDPDKAADVVQNAFIKAYVNLQSFDTSKKLSSWLYRIVHNEAVNIIRKESRTFSLDGISFAERLLAHFDEPDVQLQDKEVKKLLKKSLDELPLSYRAPLVLFYLEDKTYDEISEVLRMPVGTVGTRINRGKKQLKEIVQKKGGHIYAR